MRLWALARSIRANRTSMRAAAAAAPLRVLFLNDTSRNGGPGRTLYFLLKFMDPANLHRLVVVPRDGFVAQMLREPGVAEDVRLEPGLIENPVEPWSRAIERGDFEAPLPLRALRAVVNAGRAAAGMARPRGARAPAAPPPGHARFDAVREGIHEPLVGAPVGRGGDDEERGACRAAAELVLEGYEAGAVPGQELEEVGAGFEARAVAPGGGEQRQGRRERAERPAAARVDHTKHGAAQGPVAPFAADRVVRRPRRNGLGTGAMHRPTRRGSVGVEGL